MTLRTCIQVLAGLLVGLNVFTAFSETDLSPNNKFDPDKLAQVFMGSVGQVQAETSVSSLKDTKTTLQDTAGDLARALDDKKARVESVRKDIKAVDDSIKSCHLELAMAMGSGNTAQQEALLKKLEAERQQLVDDEKTAYQAYATLRGRAFVIKILFQAIINEIDKRLDQLGNNTASGTWAATYTSDDGVSMPKGGDFSLLIDTNGTISGRYLDGGEGIPVSGTWNPASGACQGVGSDPSSPAAWNGILKKSVGGYSGSGALSFKPKAGGSGSGSWSTK